MAERIPPGFSIPLGFYDGPEVKSIPRRIRSQAIGVWALAGNYSATRLSDGYVAAETLADLGCGPAIRAALMNTLGKGGVPDPLWIEAPAGGIQFTKWPKWQRTAREVTTYRESEAERKRVARAAKKEQRIANASAMHSESTSNAFAMRPDQTANAFQGKSSGPAQTDKRPADVRRTSEQSESETESESEYRGSVESARYESDPTRERDDLSPPVNVGATRLVERAIPRGAANDATRTGLRIEASQMLASGETEQDVFACLQLWLTKPDLGVKALKSLMAQVYKTRNAPAAGTGTGSSKLRDWAELAREARDAENQTPTTKAIEA